MVDYVTDIITEIEKCFFVWASFMVSCSGNAARATEPVVQRTSMDFDWFIECVSREWRWIRTLPVTKSEIGKNKSLTKKTRAAAAVITSTTNKQTKQYKTT